MTISVRQKNDFFYAVISYKDNGKYKQKWISLGLPVKNNRRKAEAMLESIKAEFERSYSTPSGDELFVNYIKRWLYEKKPQVELSTWEGYQIYAERHIIPYFEPLKLKLREVKPQHIKDYYNFKFASGRLDGKSGGLSIASLKKHGIVLKEVLGEAVVAGHIERNPALGVKLPGKDIPQRERTFLTSEAAQKLLVAFDGHPLQGLVYVTLYYGLRRSEALGLRWSAVDFESNTLTINHTVVKNRTIERKNKVKTEASMHTYALIDDVRNILLRQKKSQTENKLKFGKYYKNSDYIFTWDDGTLFRPDYVTRGFQNVLKRHGLPMMRFHDLRHSTASILHDDKGWDIAEVKDWLRHSTVATTANVYVHSSKSQEKRMAESLNGMFSLDTKNT